MNRERLEVLFKNHTGKNPDFITPLDPSGSVRKYFRLGFKNNIFAIGTYNEDVAENRAFIEFTKHFRSKGLPVPEIYAVSEDYKYYLQEDLGDISLKDIVDKERKDLDFPRQLVLIYRKVLQFLVRFQIDGHEGLNYSLCFPRKEFDQRSMLWDLNHFKYFFLKIMNIPFSENQLEEDFQSLSSDLEMVDREYFMFRDFQSRNIMFKQDKLYFIDYQGGRKGALHYDPASLIFEARANIPNKIREELFDYYFNELSRLGIVGQDKETFKKDYYNFALIRQLQALGAYGLRGIIEKKPLFLKSIPNALRNLKLIISNLKDETQKYPELIRVAGELINLERFNIIKEDESPGLKVKVYSFSYLKGIPDDLQGHGGGFVFDCRHIENPGRYPEYRDLTGLDKKVGEFFKERTEMQRFLDKVFSIIDSSIVSYQSRGYEDLQICFGCTGGQHRSVYAAERMTEHLRSSQISVSLVHREINGY